MNNCITIIDVPMYNGSIEMAVDEILDTINSDKPRSNLCISLTGAHGIVYSKKNGSFHNLLTRFYMNLPDGMPGVWVGKLKGAKEMKRCYGPDFFAEVMKASSEKEIRHFLCGGREGVANQLQKACREKFNNGNIVGTYCPPFKPVEEYNYERIAEEINRCGTDMVWVGVSTPKQEQFAWQLAQHTNVHFLITVGAAFDFHVGNVPQAPSWMQKAGLEWFFRLCAEPQRLYKRYFEIVPKFLFYSARDLVSYYRYRGK